MAGLRLGRNSLGQLLVNRFATGLKVDAQARVEGVQRTTLTALQVRTLDATPIEIVAAPGATWVTVVSRIVVSKAAGDAFGGIAGGEDLTFQYETAAVKVVGDMETTGFLDATTAEIRIARPLLAASGLDSIDLTDALDEAIEISLLVGPVTLGSEVIIDTYYERFPSFLA